VQGTRLDPGTVAAIESGLHPRPEVVLLTARNDVQVTAFEDVANWIERVPRRVPALARRGAPYLALAARALRSARGRSALLATGEDVGLPLALMSAVGGSRRPVFVITHGSFFSSKKFRLLSQVVGRLPFVHVLGLSEAVRQAMISRFGFPASRAHTTGYGADTRFFEPASGVPSGRLVASAGVAYRDYRSLIAASAGLDAQLKLAVGSAWFPAEVDITGAALPSHVETGTYDYPKLRRLYAEASCVVVPLYQAWHACGYAVIADAMAMAKPIVATRTHTPGDFLVEGETGFYVAPGDVAGLADRIRFLLDHPDEAARMGRRGRERAEALFSVEAYCERIEKVIASVIQRSG
jgi:glycosyltransferase involved in cell wall biosynthesis